MAQQGSAQNYLVSSTTSARNAAALILHGDLVAAIENLSVTSKSGMLLDAKLDGIVKRLEGLEQYHIKNEAEYYRQLKSLESEKSGLESRRSGLQQSIAGKEASIRETERQLSNARDAMNAARRERDRAQREYNEMKTFWWVPIIGQILVVKEMFEENGRKADDAQRRMNNYDREASDLNSDLNRFKNDLASLNRDIQNIQSSLNLCYQNINKVQSDIRNITSAIAEVLDAKVYWRDSVSQNKSAVNETSHLEELVEIGKEKPLKFTSSEATKDSVKIFESSWGKVEDVLSKAFLNKISITFKCTRCKTTKTTLPYIVSDHFVCEDCYC